jgi:hypothetical protein
MADYWPIPNRIHRIFWEQGCRIWDQQEETPPNKEDTWVLNAPINEPYRTQLLDRIRTLEFQGYKMYVVMNVKAGDVEERQVPRKDIVLCTKRWEKNDLMEDAHCNRPRTARPFRNKIEAYNCDLSEKLRELGPNWEVPWQTPNWSIPFHILAPEHD